MVFEQGFRQERLPCPNCGTPLVEIDRSEILIDACPKCRGVWLDRGELDRLLDKERRLAAGVADDDRDFIREMRGEPVAASPRPRSAPTPERDYRRRDYDDDDDYRDRKRKKRRLSLLEELFDFD